MSHFSVMVIGPDVAEQLQPYHEYECTGVDDQYVVDVDTTDEIEAEFAKPQTVLRLADGRVFGRYDNRFYVGSKGRFGFQDFVMPDGAVELEMAADEARQHGVGYQDMDACAETWNGAKRGQDGRYYRRTNPNAKWDWWVVGGRWTGYFLLKPRAKGIIGQPSFLTEPAPAGYCDQAYKRDIDFDQMRADKEIKARLFWQETRRLTGGQTWESWDDVRARFGWRDGESAPEGWDVDAARAAYNDQPAVKALKVSGKSAYSWSIDDDLTLDLDIYQARERDGAVVPYAFVRDSVWSEKGKVGWFGMSSGEISQAQWNGRFNALLDGLPDDTLLTMVDCHI